MAIATVVATIHHEEDNTWTIEFPDFPGAGTAGDTFEEAIRRGTEHIQAHIEGHMEAGIPLPELRSVDMLIQDKAFTRDLPANTSLNLVWVEMPGKSVRLNISMDDGLVARIDRTAAMLGETRSGFLAEAAKMRLQAEGGKMITEALRKATPLIPSDPKLRL